jgi:hypothetical protein
MIAQGWLADAGLDGPVVTWSTDSHVPDEREAPPGCQAFRARQKPGPALSAEPQQLSSFHEPPSMTHGCCDWFSFATAYVYVTVAWLPELEFTVKDVTGNAP